MCFSLKQCVYCKILLGIKFTWLTPKKSYVKKKYNKKERKRKKVRECEKENHKSRTIIVNKPLQKKKRKI